MYYCRYRKELDYVRYVNVWPDSNIFFSLGLLLSRDANKGSMLKLTKHI